MKRIPNRKDRKGEKIQQSLRSLRSLRLICVASLLLSYYGSVAYAEEYLFSVPRLEMDVTVLPSAGALIEYDMDFENAPGAHPIDVVDVGLPNENYGLNEMEGYADGRKLRDIRQSQYVHPGVEVHLGDGTIPAGGSGNFQFRGVIGNLVFQDTTRKDYASLQITPTWFGSQYVRGTTDLTIRVHLPAGIQPEEVVWQDIPVTGKELVEDHVIVSWQTNRPLTGPYRIGVSFPKRVMSRVVTMTITEMLLKWYQGTFSPKARLWIAVFSGIALGIIFFRFTAGTGGCLFVFLVIVAIVLYFKHEATQVYIWPVLLVLGVVVETARRRRKGRYLPAIASVEGGGIKRGLTAPEAAVLLELPVNKVVTLILFGMIKKGLIRQTKKELAIFSVETDRPADAVIQPYETSVLKLLKGGKSIQKIDFGDVVEKLIESVAKKIKGFDLEETREYYKQIISRAWVEARSIGDLETWQKKMDEKIDWMILDPMFHDRFRPYQDRYIPRSYRPSTASSGAGGAAPSAGGGGATPSFSDVAASVSGWVQNTAQGVVAKIEGKEGIVNLGSFDKAVSKAMASSGRSGGGGGGGCACACAGCACACACAGGGR